MSAQTEILAGNGADEEKCDANRFIRSGDQGESEFREKSKKNEWL